MKQINEIKRMHQLAGIINESQLDEFGGYGFKEANPEDIDFVVANRNTDAFKQAFSPMERLDMKGLNDEELRLHIKSNIDKDDLEDAKAYMEQIMQQDQSSLGEGLDGGSFEEWYQELVNIIRAEDPTAYIVKNLPAEVKEYWEAGLTPEQVYNDEWHGDAGYYTNI
jgi:hypothetical protein